ncbi:MAG: polyhydroxyalkanoate synthesis repressor PhaR [Pseudomonadota bacterium]
MASRASSGGKQVTETDAAADTASPIKIKKYANRRLYNTATSSYVTLDTLCQMVKEGKEFEVADAKTGEDITRSVLTQIIVEEEAKGENLLPIGFLRQLISLYGSNMELIVPNYLEYTMRSFAENQDRVRNYFQETMGGVFPFANLEDMGKQNLALFERTMRMFSPFTSAATDGADVKKDAPDTSAAEDIEALQSKLDDLQAQLKKLNRP